MEPVIYMESSSSSNAGEIGGTGNESESARAELPGDLTCDACDGCDDVCDSKGMYFVNIPGGIS